MCVWENQAYSYEVRESPAVEVVAERLAQPCEGKVETGRGIENIDAICKSADIVMAARGDLALSMPWLELPAAVNHIADAANSHGTPWILATQIVEGLEYFAIPTRAEICDLAQWLTKGCSGVLLSTETAFGSRPVDAVVFTSSIMKRYGHRAPGNAI